MLHPHPFRTAARPAAALLISLSLLGLSACGGGGDSSDSGTQPDGSSGTRPASVQALTGDWTQKGCMTAGSQSYKRFLRITQIPSSGVAAAVIEISEGVLSYAGTACTGASQRVGPTQIGSVNITRSEANALIAAHWGEFLAITSQRSGSIWALRSDSTQLCWLGDEIPTIQPTLAAVSSTLSTVPESSCFVH